MDNSDLKLKDCDPPVAQHSENRATNTFPEVYDPNHHSLNSSYFKTDSSYENNSKRKCHYEQNNQFWFNEHTPVKHLHLENTENSKPSDLLFRETQIVDAEVHIKHSVVTPEKITQSKSDEHRELIKSNLDKDYSNIEIDKPIEQVLSHQFKEAGLLKVNSSTLFDAQLLSQSPLKSEANEKHLLISEKNMCNLPCYIPPLKVTTLPSEFLKIEQELSKNLLHIEYSETKVKYISNPVEHAKEPHTSFLEKYLNGGKSILFLGMNPGPWGMCQTGVPFGEVQTCKNWLKICGNVTQPKNYHPKRPIEGFGCKRREVSGERFWRFFEMKCKTPDVFFKDCFVYNHCPLAFMTETGKNITPPQIGADKRALINNLCDNALVDVIKLLGVSSVIGVGKFAEKRANEIKKKFNLDISVFFLLHPSPASPAANKGWSDIAEVSLRQMNILGFL